MKAGKVLIHGEWVESSSEEVLDVINPSTGKVITKIANCTKCDVDKAVSSSLVGFEKWKRTSADVRAEIMHKAASLIREKANQIATEITNEAGKLTKWALREVNDSADIIDFFAEEGLRIKGEVYQYNFPNEQVQVIKEPVGVVASITAANFPVALLSWKLGAALASGCSVIAKPDERASTSALLIGQSFLEAGLPFGVFNIITGNGITGELLVKHPDISKIAFTGSVAIGKRVAALATETCKRISLELGGQCPAIIMSGVDPIKIISEFMSQSFKNSGQYCYRINRVYIHRDVYDDFIQVLLDKVSKLKIGKADEPNIDQGPLYHKSILEHAMSHIEDAINKGATLLCGGKQIPSETNTYYLEPTIFENSTHDMLIMNEESFAPILSIMKIESLSEAIKHANNSTYGLAAFVYTPDSGLGLQAARQIDAGVVWVNKIHKAYTFAPFGGMKQSGYGREKSSWGLDEYLELKTVYLDLPSIQ